MNIGESSATLSSPLLWGAVAIAWGLALLAVVAGRNLTRSLTAAAAAMVPLVLLVSGTFTPGLAERSFSSDVGLGAIVTLLVVSLGLMLVQLFGWMLVDVDHDHLAPTDRGTRLARSLAVLILGAALVFLGIGVCEQFEWMDPAILEGLSRVQAPAERSRVRDFAVLAGLLLAAGLLASLLVLREEGEER